MRLLYNNMLSDKLIAQLADIYPDSLHIKNIGPENVPDTEVWTYAREHGLTIVTKDRDYREISQARGHPPKVVLITLLDSTDSIPTSPTSRRPRLTATGRRKSIARSRPAWSLNTSEKPHGYNPTAYRRVALLAAVIPQSLHDPKTARPPCTTNLARL